MCMIVYITMREVVGIGGFSQYDNAADSSTRPDRQTDQEKANEVNWRASKPEWVNFKIKRNSFRICLIAGIEEMHQLNQSVNPN